jgi:hypothetical protein
MFGAVLPPARTRPGSLLANRGAYSRFLIAV